MPPFFCAALETARDVVVSYAKESVGALPEHSLEDMMMLGDKFILPDPSKLANKSGTYSSR